KNTRTAIAGRAREPLLGDDERTFREVRARARPLTPCPARRVVRLVLALSLATAATAHAEPLDLTACVRLALAHNPDVQDAVDATLSAVLGRDVPLADYHFKAVPSVSGGLQGNNNTNQRYDLELSRKLMLTGTQIAL